ncbi:MAG: LysR family transcriptional regulator [Lachnospiraceae bacterium]
MNDKEMRYIVTAADTGSMQKAAWVLGKSSSTLSRSMKRIEEELGIRLFRRTTSGVQLTPEGEVYVKAAREILELFGQLESCGSREDHML